MLLVKNIDSENYSLVYDFLKAVPSINSVDERILKNASALFDDEKVIGCISFEEYDSIGLIRYFVFKKNLSILILNKLLSNLEDNAKGAGLIKLVCVADNTQIEELFKEMEFEMINKKIYLNEEILKNTIYGRSKMLLKNIK